MAPTAKVLIFDSGVGGLSIAHEIRQLIPGIQLYFASDNAAFPYGTKSEQFLLERVDHALKALSRRIDPDIIVVACNTASTLILPRIRSHFTNPVVGVVPAIKPAAQLTRSKVIGLLATPATVQREYTAQLIREFAADCQIVAIGSSELVHIAEQKLRQEKIDLEHIKTVIAPLFDNPDLDTIVLACTHFPLLRQELEAAAPREVNWVDSGNAIARRVNSLLPEQLSPQPTLSHSLPHSLPHSPYNRAALFARHDDTLARLAPGLAQFGFDDIEIVDF